MSFCNRVAMPRIVLSVVSVLALAFLVACGSSSNKATPPPTGGFSNSNLNGTYVFSTQGFDASTGSPITIAGAFTACGCAGGTISGGNLTYVDPGIATASGQTINASSYSVGVDGRGTATLNTASASPFNVITLDFALNSTNGGTVSEFDSTGTGSGTIALATSVAQSDIENSTGYAYMVTGEDSTESFSGAAAGAFVVSSSDNLSGGIYDLSEVSLSNGTVSGFAGFTFTTASTVTVGTGTAPGAATLTDGSNTYTFDVYAVSANDLKLIETDGHIVGSGDAFAQTSLPSGTLAFTMNGLDDSNGAPLSMGGLLPFSGGTITAGTQDYNDGGTSNTQASVGGSFPNPLSGGRTTLQLTGFFNGGLLVPPNVTFAAYPTTNGTLLVEIDGGGVTAGSALVQTNTSLAASQGYAMDISATNIGSGSGEFEEDDIAEFTSTSSGFSGLVDVNDEGTTTGSNPPTFDGTYSSLSTGRYQFTANPSGNFGGVSGAVYTVDGQTLLFLEGDAAQIGTGILQVQNSSGAAKAAARQPVMTFHQLAAAHAAKWHKK